MEELLLINPRRRKGATKRRAGGHRTAAQKRATAKLVAMNRARRAPARRARARHHSPAVYAPNPIRRRRHATRTVRSAARRRYRRNPVPRTGNLMHLLTSSAQGAMGAIVINTAFNFVPLPAMLKTGSMQYVAKGALAVMLGMFVRNRMVAEMVKGSLTVTMHDAIKDIAGTMIPGMPLGYYSGGQTIGYQPGVRAAPSPSALSEYINRPGMAGMAEMHEMSDYSY